MSYYRAGNPENSPIVQHLRGRFPEAVQRVADHRGDLAVWLARDPIVEITKSLRDDPSCNFNFLIDIAGVDWLGRSPRFEVVYHLYSLDKNHRVRLHVGVPEDDPTIDSVITVWRGADWFERECYDLVGIKFRGHPYLRRILTHDDFQGHPLRKDYDQRQRWRCTAVSDLESTVEVPAKSRPGYCMMATERLPVTAYDDQAIGEETVVNIGPSHPAMHGTLRIKAWLDGEMITRAKAEIGYLHRCFEKESETHTYTGIIPYTDRLNYLSGFMNNVGYCLAVEKLFDIEAPPRAQVIRVILSEFSRIMDHLVCLGTSLVDIGALTNFWYFFRPREEIYALIESCSGARMMATYCRVGGLVKDIPPDFEKQCRGILAMLPRYIDDVDNLAVGNRIFIDRTRGIGPVTAEEAIAYGFTGPCLRASGVRYDIRKKSPYSGYEKYQFDVPTGDNGDTWDRFVVRMTEMRQSIRIIEQALGDIPAGSFLLNDRRVALPDKELVYTNIEALMNHFKIIMEGIKPPAGEVYSYTEAANGELGFYIIADGSGHPYRIKVRPPCFAIYQAYEKMLIGHRVSDAIAILGGLNVVAGELDR